MAKQILCQQFIYSKFAGASRSASYTTIARSSGLTDDYIKQIRKAFNGCRPDATDLATYKPSYAMSSIGDADLAFLRLDVVEDAESGNKFILYERYIVIAKEHLRKNNLKPLRLLRLLSYPEAIPENKTLEDTVEIEGKSFSNLLRFEEIKKDYEDSLFFALYCLLSSRQLLVFLQKDSIDWEWLTLLDALAPKECTMGLRLFLGVSKTKDWSPDLEIRYNTRVERNVSIIMPTGIGFEDASIGYTDFLQRCYKNNLSNLFVTTLTRSDALDFEIFRDKKSSYDVLLKKELPPDFRLELVRAEFKSKKNVEGELSWLWRNASFDFDDIQKFLPLLLLTIVDKWSKNDFLILSRYIESFGSKKISPVLENEQISNSARARFLMRWGQSVESLSPLDLSIWVSLLICLAKQEPDTSFGVLVQFLKFVDLSKSKDVKKIITSFPKSINSKSSSLFWTFAAWLLCHVKQTKDIDTCVDILSSLEIFPESYNLLKYLNYLLKQYKEGDSGIDLANQVVTDTNNAQILSTFIPHIINVTLISNYPDALVNLALSIKNIKTSLLTSYGFGSNTFKPNENILISFYENILADSNEKYISAYIFLLCRFSNKERVGDALFDILIRNANLFSNVVNFCVENLDMDIDCFAISVPKLKELKQEEQLQLLIVYFISIEKIGQPFRYMLLLKRNLMSVTSLKFVNHHLLESFLSLLLGHGEWAIARIVLEHQVRTSILRKDTSATANYLKRLYKVISSEHTVKPKDFVKKKMVVSYLRELPEEPQQEFIAWLFFHPLSSSTPFLKNARLQPLTSKFIFSHEEWLTEDAFVRYCLFEELSTWDWR